MKISKVIIAFTLVCNFTLLANESDKIYILQDQIQIENGNIAVDINGNKYNMSALHKDAGGFYVIPNELLTDDLNLPYCKNGHPSPNNDGLCFFPGCPFNR